MFTNHALSDPTLGASIVCTCLIVFETLVPMHLLQLQNAVSDYLVLSPCNSENTLRVPLEANNLSLRASAFAYGECPKNAETPWLMCARESLM